MSLYDLLLYFFSGDGDCLASSLMAGHSSLSSHVARRSTSIWRFEYNQSRLHLWCGGDSRRQRGLVFYFSGVFRPKLVRSCRSCRLQIPEFHWRRLKKMEMTMRTLLPISVWVFSNTWEFRNGYEQNDRHDVIEFEFSNNEENCTRKYPREFLCEFLF